MRRISGKRKIKIYRMISLILVIELCVGSLFTGYYGDQENSLFSSFTSMIAHAEGAGLPISINSTEELVTYSRNYNSSHKNDIIKITFSDTATTGGLSNFKKMGTSSEDAFDGTIILAGASITLNLPTAMFGYVTDDVSIEDVSGNAAELTITRIYDRDDQPLFAEHVIQKRSSGTPVKWKFHYDRYRDPEYRTINVYQFAGYIGTLESGAKVNIESIVHDNASESNVSNMIATTGDIGLVCRTMAENSELTVGSITIGAHGSGNYQIQSKANGNAGGIVGSMANNSRLVLGSGITNPQGAGKNITALDGFAGGIVGKCDGGTIVLNNTAPYALSQVINGKSGAGGIAGYYQTKSAADVTVSTEKFSYNSYQVNGDGKCGGLFGELVNNGGNFLINGATAVAADHSSGSASSLGGLIGSYSAVSLNNSLTVSTTGVITPSKTGGSAAEYGGVIGTAAKDSYVRLNSVAVNASNAANFGGAVGSADGAFIDVNNLTVTAAPADYSGGGVVNALGNGVLRLTGAINLANAKASGGQIVHTRDYGLVFAESGWTFTRRSDAAMVDDIGSWGEVLRFDSVSEADIFNGFTDGDHFVRINPAVLSMENTTDFVKTALNIQLNKTVDENDAHVMVFDSASGSAALLASTGLELKNSSVAIDLTGTGITGLTRDSGDNCVEFSGTFNGNGGSIRLAVGESYAGSGAEGTGKIYRHTYNGLFAKTKNATIRDITIARDSSIRVRAEAGMYVGNVVAQASGMLTLEGIEVAHSTTYATIEADGGNASTVGGLVGDIGSQEGAAAGVVSITRCTYDGEIKGGITGSKIGGMIGKLTGGTVTVSSSAVKGKITAAAGNNVGGTIAVTASSNLTLNDLTVDGLVMSVAGNSGGFLGHEWSKTEVVFNGSGGSTGVTVENSASLTSGDANTAGLVRKASGYWKVNGSGITLDASTSITAANATTFGLLVNDGTELYLELLPSAYAAGAGISFNFGTGGPTVFDELVAKTVSGTDPLANGQGIVSIATSGHAKLPMGSYGGAGATYQHQTNYLGNHANLYDNPKTRYYYNLDAYRLSANQSTDAQKLLIWSVRQYAHSQIKKYFQVASTTIGSGVSSDLDMAGYSYYPVDLTDTLNLKGAVHLYNVEFDTTENSTTDKRLSTESGNQSQHYMIHNSLFRNVSGSLTFAGSLNGNVRNIDSYCGALVMGNVGSDEPSNPAKITVNSLSLAGIGIESANGPLLINTASSNATLMISDVSNTSAYSGKGVASGTTIATSLLGTMGSSSASQLKLTFSGIKLDGRNAAGYANLSGLTTVYGTNGSLFSDATLVGELAYEASSGSFGVYNYTYDEDWGGNPADRKVTYGAEIDNTVENRDSNNNSKQRNYNNDTTKYTRPDSSADVGSAYGHFARDFQKYVSTGYNEGNCTHELRINIPGNTSAGCGTYNDPYLITSGTIMQAFVNIINGDNTSSMEISVPKGVVDHSAVQTWCEDKEDHYSFDAYAIDTHIWSGTGHSKTITNDKLREYLAGAYYKLDEFATIELDAGENGFKGFSNKVNDSRFVFHGVIDGSGNTIVNKSNQPLIVSSYGSVVYNLVLDVQPESAKALTQSSESSVFTNDSTGCEFYGAVMGQIFGGDNIIDDVEVTYTGTIINMNGASKSQLVPIGGYVGVVVNGGLIFRNMKGGNSNNKGGISKENLTGFTNGVGKTPDDPTASDNTMWLYINPIIGRVLNGYAVTESTTYKPFEDGSRTYPDGSKEYWQSDGTFVTATKEALSADSSLDQTYLASAAHVTMQNGTKNYSIADISTSDTNSFSMSGITNNSTITISSAQALFIMSLITECGLGKSDDGLYKQCDYLKPYDKYMSTHLADYDEIGSNAANTSGHDYDASAKNDAFYTIWSSTNEETIIPYIIQKYTPKSGSIYPAFCCAGGYSETSQEIVHYHLSLSGVSGNEIHLPDSYRGLGSLMFGVKNPSVSTLYGKTITGDNQKNLDNFKENVIFLYSLDGANKVLSLYMNLYLYEAENYPTLNGPQANFKTGFAFINCLQSDHNNNSARVFKDLTLRGSVKYTLINTTGVPTACNDNTAKGAHPAVAAFVGVPVGKNWDGKSGEPYDTYFQNITVDSMDISGLVYVGGFVGAYNVAGTLTFESCGADDLKVYSGGAAGGLVGFLRNLNGKIRADFEKNGASGKFGIISVESGHTETSDDYAGAGGLLGCRNSTSNNNPTDTVNDNFKISNVTICNGKSVASGYIGYNRAGTNTKAISAGGVVGSSSRALMVGADHVTVSNLSICASSAGGFIGRLQDTQGDSSRLTVTDSCVTTTENCVIESTYTDSNPQNDKDSSAASGGFVGIHKAKQKVTITDSQLYGYTIVGFDNVGGIIGVFGTSVSGKTYRTEIKNVELSGHRLKGYKDLGGLVGSIAGTYSRELMGYNIRINDQTSEAYTSGSSIVNNGYLIGNNGSNNNALIRIVGFSRQGTIDVEQMVGSKGDNSPNRYGEGGYVIFADYNDTAETDENPEFANMQASGINIGAEGDHASVSTITYKYKVIDGSIVGDKIDLTAPVTGSSLPYDSTLGDTPVSTYSATEYEYIPVSVPASSWVPVESVSELLDDNSSRGFYLYCNGSSKYFVHNSSNQVFNTGTNKVIYEGSSSSNAAVWHFENVTSNEYRIYTIIGNIPYYIKDTSDKYLEPTTDISEACIFEISDAYADNVAFNNDPDITSSQQIQLEWYKKTFYFKVKNKGWWLSHSGDGKGMRFWNQHFDVREATTTNYQSNQNESIKIYCVPSGVKLQVSEYDNVTINGTTISPVGSPTTTRDATADEITMFTTKCGSSTTAVLYDITETIKQNQFVDNDNSHPYVTTNPRKNVTMDSSDPPKPVQWLTSDGVSKGTYNGSAAYNIITSIRNGTADKKRYKNTGLTTQQLNDMEERLYNNLTTIRSASTCQDPYDGEDFPVLIVNDISTADQAVNGYLKLLTNTSYNFACGYLSEGTTASDQDIYHVDITKWLYNHSTGKFEKQDDEASLKCFTNTGFRINANDLDNGKWQISLVDVQFFDPTGTGRIAYHLYVPVVVKKMLFYTVDLKAASTTTYKLDAYPTMVQNLLENLGNPITFKLTYTYQQTAEAWASAINNGENVCRNYQKVLDIINFNQNFPADARIVLLDPNNNIDKFYNGRFSAGSGGAITQQQGTAYQLQLEDFTDPTDNNAETNGFSPVLINDLMTITVNEGAEQENKNLVECALNDPELITIVRDYRYPDPEHEGEYLTRDLPLRYKHDTEPANTVYYAVNVALKENQNNGDYVQEHYYISIFTKVAPNDANIYHYEVETSGSTLNDPSYPTALKGNVDAPHLFLGNLYNNSVTIRETNPNSKMDATNNTLSADLTATIGFTQNAINSNIIDQIESNVNVKVYQTFLISLDRMNGELGNQRGILVDPTSVIPAPGSYKINHVEPAQSEYELSSVISDNYIELRNGYNIKDDLVAKAKAAIQAGNPTEDDYKITVNESVSWSYAVNTLPEQFPKSSPETPQIGTIMIGYSNISATPEGGAASRESKNTEARQNALRYYVDNDTTVDFSYNAVGNPEFQNDGNGNYGQLGLNGCELDEDGNTYVSINTGAYYDAHDYNLKNRAHYLKMMIRLSKKSDYTAALDIPTYLKDFEVKDNNGDPIVILPEEDDPTTLNVNEAEVNQAINAANGYVIDTSDPSKIYTYIIPVEKLEISDDIYYIPINFKAYSGKNSDFEQKTGSPAPDMQYSNYKVQVTVGLLETKDGGVLQNSSKTDHIIYTNARIYSDVIS